MVGMCQNENIQGVNIFCKALNKTGMIFYKFFVGNNYIFPGDFLHSVKLHRSACRYKYNNSQDLKLILFFFQVDEQHKRSYGACISWSAVFLIIIFYDVHCFLCEAFLFTYPPSFDSLESVHELSYLTSPFPINVISLFSLVEKTLYRQEGCHLLSSTDMCVYSRCVSMLIWI